MRCASCCLAGLSILLVTAAAAGQPLDGRLSTTAPGAAGSRAAAPPPAHDGAGGTQNILLPGACCQCDDDMVFCEINTGQYCTSVGGVFLGHGTDCEDQIQAANSPNLTIPDNNPAGVSDTIVIAPSGTILDVNIGLVVPHTWVGDLCVTLTHGATTVSLIEEVGNPIAGCGNANFGCSSNDLNVVLDDEGAGGALETLNCPGSALPYPTSPPGYTPLNPLSAFDGLDATGNWTINVRDSAGGDIGTLVSWSVEITVPACEGQIKCAGCGPPPCPVVCPGGAYQENETCGGDINGGCNSTPTVFTMAACGQTWCGTAWANGNVRDTDWYLVNHGGGLLSGTVVSEFPAQCFIVDGIGSCRASVVGNIGCSIGCTNLAVASADLPAGQYVVFVGTGACNASLFDGYPCGQCSDYTLTIECQPSTQACCLPGVPAECVDTANASNCQSLGGVMMGEGTECATTNCSVQACCFEDGSCQMLSVAACLNHPDGGSPQGANSACIILPDCPILFCPTTEACCFGDGHCSQLDAKVCGAAGGLAQGEGSVCDGKSMGPNGLVVHCPQPQACCFADGSCEDLAPRFCIEEGGLPQGEWTDCTDAGTLCRQACCHELGTCTDLLPYHCWLVGSVPQGLGTACDDEFFECTPITEACCLLDGSCVDIHRLKCLVLCGTPGGEDTECESTKCTPPLAGDADYDGDVDIFDLLLLLGTYGPCTDDNNPCPPEPCAADFDGNGEIDIFDVLLLLEHWG